MSSIPRSPSPTGLRKGRIRPWIALRGIVGQIHDSENTAAGARLACTGHGQGGVRWAFEIPICSSDRLNFELSGLRWGLHTARGSKCFAGSRRNCNWRRTQRAGRGRGPREAGPLGHRAGKERLCRWHDGDPRDPERVPQRSRRELFVSPGQRSHRRPRIRGLRRPVHRLARDGDQPSKLRGETTYLLYQPTFANSSTSCGITDRAQCSVSSN